jgi:hypothetical protein
LNSPDGKLDRADGGDFFVALGGGYSIRRGLFLAAYFFWPDAPTVLTKLHGYERDVRVETRILPAIIDGV